MDTHKFIELLEVMVGESKYSKFYSNHIRIANQLPEYTRKAEENAAAAEAAPAPATDDST